MCGIAGIFAYQDPQRSWPQEELNTMVQKLEHRGPDDKGVHVEPGLFLGHRRLSVIDLSQAGHQPMMTADKNFIITYNGEIYNFKEIRAELESLGHQFVSNSDTEVLLLAWRQWKEACLEKLDGIFAFAVFDRQQRTLFLVRDHLGVKPLFYTLNKGQLFFASELPALFGQLNPYPDCAPNDLDEYFTFNYLSAPRSGLRGVSQLAAGSMLIVNQSGERVHRYWKPTYGRHIETWSPQLADRFQDLLNITVQHQLISDAPLGLFLSGGLDSYSVALAAISAGRSPRAFTLGFPEKKFNEVPAASEYARHLKIQNDSSLFSFTEADISETLGSMRELLADPSCFPIYQLCKFTRKNVTVALSGDGGDELLAGYDTYRAGNLTPHIRMIPPVLRTAFRKMARYLPSDNQRYGWRMVLERILDAADEGPQRDHASFRRIFSPAMKKHLYTPEFWNETARNDPVGKYAQLIKEVPASRSYLTGRQHADLLFHLPSILAKVDRMSMAHGLEVRVPLLSKDIVEFCLSLPDEAKRYQGKGKRILRQVVMDQIPRGSLSRPKAGFLPPIDQWFRRSGPMHTIFGDHLETARRSLLRLRWDQVEKLWDQHQKGIVNSGFVLLGILQFINWRSQPPK